MTRLSLMGIGLGVSLVAGCTIDTGYEPPPPPPYGAPFTGGTMAVTRDGTRAVVADPDRDLVVIVDLTTEQIADTITLPAGSQPGRVIDDGAGRIHIALRGTGELLTITGSDRTTQPICGEPRGLAWQESTDTVHVACATGELVSVPAGGGDPTRVVRLERDLRDVVVRGDGLVVTTFRSAQAIVLDAQGNVVTRIAPPVVQRTQMDPTTGMMQVPATPEVAWRSVVLADGTIMMAHQRRLGTTLRIITGGYGASCAGSPVESTLTSIGVDNKVSSTNAIADSGLPLDVAVNPITGDIAMASAGATSVVFLPRSITTTQPDSGQCPPMPASHLTSVGNDVPTSVAYRPDGTLVIYYPEANGLILRTPTGDRGISLGDRPRSDAGRTLFHRVTSSGLACASCHPEGRDDGGVWTFDTLGPRRTQNLAGGVLARAPFHWGADMPTFHSLVENVFTERMGGDFVDTDQERALGAWLDRVPAPKGVVADADAVARGKDLFEAPEQGCLSCHNGPAMTNKEMANVIGTTVKVPSLIGVGARAPFMHDGCAATLRDRFGVCGGGDRHGHTSQLTDAQLADLVAYLESL